ncbi:WXG100 family type VII secretion target [Nonomuraea maritima]|uniref:WXG100 family type VII secretion target n=1 Tax=Nonomuraea maritima TaxID=683260 RepID=UPI003724671E
MSADPAPGRDELDAMLRKVTGAPGDIDDLARAWRSVAGEIEEFAGGMSAAVRTVDDAWRGRSAQQFVTYMGRYGAAAGSLRAALTGSAAALESAASALREARTEIAAICRDLDTSLANYRRRFYADQPDATEADLRPGLARLVGQARTAAQEWVDSADEAVTKAKNTVKRFVDEHGPTFRAIPDVSRQEFTPAPGRRIEWLREPGYQERGGVPATTALSGAHAPSYGPSGPPPAGGGPAPTEQVRKWIEEAVAILARHGVPVSKMDPDDIWTIVRHESGGNPHAINNWDSNAAQGTPSKGLMQTIDPTFNAHALPGHRDIYDPVDNIIAGVRYAISRYGSVANVPGVVNTRQGLGYVGY